MVDWAAVEADLAAGLALVQKLSPAAAIGGPVAAAIGTVVGSVAGLASQYLTLATSAEAVIASNNLSEIQQLTIKLQAENDAIAKQISAS